MIAVGKGKVRDDGKLTPLDVKKGDRVLFGKYSGTEVKVDGEEHLIIREDDVLAVLELEKESRHGAKEIKFDQDARERSSAASNSSRTR